MHISAQSDNKIKEPRAFAEQNDEKVEIEVQKGKDGGY